MMHQPIWNAQPGDKAVSPLLLHAPGNLPIVVASMGDYPAEWWYSPASVKLRLTYLSDESYAVQQPDFLGELSVIRDRAYVPLPTSDYAAFVGSHPHFLLLCTGEARFSWAPSRLASAGWHLNPIARNGKDVLYRVDRP